MFRTRRKLENEILKWKATAKMHKAEAREIEIDLSFSRDREARLLEENRRLTARLKGAEALYGAAMRRIEQLEGINGRDIQKT